jgi:hypothetical protein
MDVVISRQHQYRKSKGNGGGWVFKTGDRIVSSFPPPSKHEDDCINIQLFYHHGWDISTELGGVGGSEVFAQDGLTVRERFFRAWNAKFRACSDEPSFFYHFRMSRSLPVVLDLLYSAAADGTITLISTAALIPPREVLFRFLCLKDKVKDYVRLYPADKKTMRHCEQVVKRFCGALLHSYYNVHVHKTSTLLDIPAPHAPLVTELHHAVFRGRGERITFPTVLHWFQYEHHAEDALFCLFSGSCA